MIFEATGSLNDEQLRTLHERLTYLRNLEEKKNQVLGSIEEQGKLTAELKKQILDAQTLVVVEDLYRPFRPKRRTRAIIAKEKGLEPLANIIMLQMTDKPIEEEPEGCVNPKAFIRLLGQKLPDNSVVSADVGQNQIWTVNNIGLKNGRFITSGGMGTMGYSVPAALGAKAARPDSEVVAICGDGSFQMQFMELATMIQHNIAVKVIVMTNNRLGMERELQTNGYDNRLTAVFLDGSPDFIKLADSYGIPAKRITDIADADKAIDEMLSSKGCYLLEVRVAENEKTIL